MTRLARRNRTRQIKLWKRRGYKYRRGLFWLGYCWQTVVPTMARQEWKEGTEVLFATGKTVAQRESALLWLTATTAALLE